MPSVPTKSLTFALSSAPRSIAFWRKPLRIFSAPFYGDKPRDGLRKDNQGRRLKEFRLKAFRIFILDHLASLFFKLEACQMFETIVLNRCFFPCFFIIKGLKNVDDRSFGRDIKPLHRMYGYQHHCGSAEESQPTGRVRVGMMIS